MEKNREKKRHRLWIGGEWCESSNFQEVRSPYSGEGVAQVDQANSKLMSEAISAASAAFQKYRRTSRYARSRILAGIAQGLQARRPELVESIVLEAGKPKTLSEAEVSRAINTFTIASEEAKRFTGSVIPIDIEPAGRVYLPVRTTWVPRGPVLAIAPFNFPLNLIAHKIAPALAVGNSILLKPPPQAPGAAAILAQIFCELVKQSADIGETIPLSTLQVVNASNEVVGPALEDPRIAILSFTGSDRVGWMLAQKAYRKKVCLELGGNAAVVIHSDADLVRAATRCAYGAFAYAGQICISVQRIYVHGTVAPKFQELFLAEIKKIKTGDPTRDDVLVGPLIDDHARDRLKSWIEEAKSSGGKVLCGGGVEGRIMEPIVLTNVSPDQKISCEEAFGPVAVLETYSNFEEAVASVNRSRFGLQTGVFTNDFRLIQKAIEELETGGVIINEIPTFRADNMPYGGFKDSGNSKEGVLFAMQEFCDLKTIVLWRG